ncbi:hypothetical protein NQZ68_003895 [Dissostichus eleginoides]|nr:hypothetical protein NQZ68_003895 [Dissostichus eleginoides]
MPFVLPGGPRLTCLPALISHLGRDWHGHRFPAQTREPIFKQKGSVGGGKSESWGTWVVPLVVFFVVSLSLPLRHREIYFCCQLLKGLLCPSEKSPLPSCGGVVAIEGASCMAIPSEPRGEWGPGTENRQKVRIRPEDKAGQEDSRRDE